MSQRKRSYLLRAGGSSGIPWPRDLALGSLGLNYYYHLLCPQTAPPHTHTPGSVKEAERQ